MFPNGHKIKQPVPFQSLPNFTQIEIFGLKINHLATLLHNLIQHTYYMLRCTLYIHIERKRHFSSDIAIIFFLCVCVWGGHNRIFSTKFFGWWAF
jgi:hypothetical protein